MNKLQKQPINWKSTLVLTLTPLAAMILVPYYALTYGFSVWDWLWFSLFIIATGLSITAGYHRLWSHRAYKANSILKIFFMLFGAATLQNSIITWAADHRKHHRHVDDQEKDPYAATKGFWYSHIGWMLRYKPDANHHIENVKDLKDDKIVAFQHRYYLPIALFMCFGLPMLIGATYGSIGGCLILVGLFRLVINHHFTFFINSLAHIWGKERYTDENTAKDNPLLSILTFGEGYHNFHHKYAGDYRNGVLWYDYDPSKWLIFLASKIGWAYDLKQTPKPTIEAARASMQFKRAQEKLKAKPYLARVVELEKSLEAQYKELFETIKKWAKAKQEHLNAQKEKLSAAHIAHLKEQYILIKKQFKAERRLWHATMSSLAI